MLGAISLEKLKICRDSRQFFFLNTIKTQDISKIHIKTTSRH